MSQRWMERTDLIGSRQTTHVDASPLGEEVGGRRRVEEKGEKEARERTLRGENWWGRERSEEGGVFSAEKKELIVGNEGKVEKSSEKVEKMMQKLMQMKLKVPISVIKRHKSVHKIDHNNDTKLQ
mgnify:CR=1 FL=1